MKIFKKTFLPNSVAYNGNTYTVNHAISTGMRLSGTTLKAIDTAVKSTGKKAICVEVLSKNLKVKTDLHGQPYKPTRHIFTT